MRRQRRSGVVTLLAVTVAAQLVACSSEQATAGPRETTSTTSTTVKARTATSSTTTTTAPGQWVPDDLLPCAAPSGQSTGYTTVGTWLPTSIPDGLMLESASSFVATSDLDVRTSAGYRDFVLAEVAADGRVGQVLHLVRGGRGYHQPGFAQVDDEPSLDRVRGRPGSVARWINRGDTYGQIVAEWQEGGSSWQASGGAPSVESGVEAFAAALQPLELSDDDVTDPTGRFAALGTTTGSSWVGGAEITLSTPDASVFDPPVVRIGIAPAADGTDGLPSLATGQDATYELVAGRPASFDRFVAITLTDDGSVATAEITRERAGDLTGRDLVPMLQSLRAVDHDDPALVGLPLVDRATSHNGFDWATITTDAALGYCRDW